MINFVAPHAPAAPPIDPFTGAEINRIVNLPIHRPMDAVELEEFNRMFVQATAFQSGWRLFPLQAEGLAAYLTQDSLFGCIGVGFGKTLLSLMVANAAFAKGFQKIILFLPPEIMGQLTRVDIPWARSKVAIQFPIHILGGQSMEYRRALCKSGRKGLYIMPYSLLSTKDTHENLTALAPQLVIADEAHRLANHSAARTRRVVAMLEKFKPEFVILSGSITSKTIKDYYHLIKACLRNNCPLPMSKHMADDWAALIDSEASREGYGTPPNTMAIAPLSRWAEKHFPNTPGGFPADVFGFRRAYKARLNSAPGVISSGDASIGTSLMICNQPVLDYEKHPNWPTLEKFIDQVTEMWLTPNGDEIDHAIHTWKWLNELCGAGFYNQLTWPEVPDFAKRKNINEQQAAEIIQKAKTHHLAGQAYSRELRDFLLERSKPGIDTPFLCGQSMMRDGDKFVSGDMFKLWKRWKDLDFDGRPERDSTAIRVCDFKIKAAVEWVKKLRAEKPKTGAIIWCHHQEVGKWVIEELVNAGVIDALHCPGGGEQFNRAILDPLNGGKIIAASITAHGTGKNLQHFSEQFFMQWPRDARTAEQVIGRTHRNGQKADELIINTNMTLFFDQLNFAACLNDSLYIHQTTGNRQKLIYANYDPLPKIFPPAVMAQKGLETARLDKELESKLHEKFGNYT